MLPCAMPATGQRIKIWQWTYAIRMSGYRTCWENLPEEKLASALKDDNPNWEYIDGEIVKLGSLADRWISRNSSAGGWSFWLVRFSSAGASAENPATPVILISHCACWRCGHYWAVAAPQNMAHKNALPARSLNAETGIEVFTERRHSAARCAVGGTGKTGAMLAVT